MRSHSFAQPRPNFARLIPVAGGLAFESTYHADMIRDFKARVPTEGRRWDPDRKRWLILPQYADLVAQLCIAYLGVTVTVPKLAATSTTTTELIQLLYLGRTKDRGGESSAFGYADGTWKLIFPEQVLREWFEAVPQRPGELPTLYAVLAIKPAATPEEVKSAYRRMAKIWHPDVNRGDSDAPEQFKIINHAYQVLSDPISRKKYEAGLAFDASLRQPAQRPYSAIPDPSGYRAPLKCGWVLAEGVETLGRFVVSKILEWQDVVNAQEQVMVTSWPMGADKPAVVWQ